MPSAAEKVVSTRHRPSVELIALLGALVTAAIVAIGWGTAWTRSQAREELKTEIQDVAHLRTVAADHEARLRIREEQAAKDREILSEIRTDVKHLLRASEKTR